MGKTKNWSFRIRLSNNFMFSETEMYKLISFEVPASIEDTVISMTFTLLDGVDL